MKYQIRKLTIDDYDSLLALWDKCALPYRPRGRDTREAIAREMKRDETGFLGMFDGRRMIGFVLATSDGRKGWINRLAVDPDYQRQGLGTYLINESEQFLYKLGLKVIAILIEGDNVASYETFKKAGYVPHPDIAYYSKRGSAED